MDKAIEAATDALAHLGGRFHAKGATGMARIAVEAAAPHLALTCAACGFELERLAEQAANTAALYPAPPRSETGMMQGIWPKRAGEDTVDLASTGDAERPHRAPKPFGF